MFAVCGIELKDRFVRIAAIKHITKINEIVRHAFDPKIRNYLERIFNCATIITKSTTINARAKRCTVCVQVVYGLCTSILG